MAILLTLELVRLVLGDTNFTTALLLISFLRTLLGFLLNISQRYLGYNLLNIVNIPGKRHLFSLSYSLICNQTFDFIQLCLNRDFLHSDYTLCDLPSLSFLVLSLIRSNRMGSCLKAFSILLLCLSLFGRFFEFRLLTSLSLWWQVIIGVLPRIHFRLQSPSLLPNPVQFMSDQDVVYGKEYKAENWLIVDVSNPWRLWVNLFINHEEDLIIDTFHLIVVVQSLVALYLHVIDASYYLLWVHLDVVPYLCPFLEL